MEEEKRNVSGREAFETPVQLSELHTATKESVLKLKSPTRGIPHLPGIDWKCVHFGKCHISTKKWWISKCNYWGCQALSRKPERYIFITTKVVQPKTNLALNKTWNTFKNRNESRMSTLTTSILHCTEGPSQCSKGRRSHKDWKQ